MQPPTSPLPAGSNLAPDQTRGQAPNPASGLVPDFVPGSIPDLVAEPDVHPQSAAWNKADWRRFLRARRQALPDRPARTRLIESHLRRLVSDLGAKVVATYLATGSEPGAFIPADQLLVPVVLPDLNIFEAPPLWGRASAELFAPCPYPPRQTPNPPEPYLPAEALAEADLVLVPGLGCDLSGTRLGQGAGWYDRALTHLRPDAQLWGVFFSSCVLPAGSLPVDSWDRPLDGFVSEAGPTRF